VTRSLLLLTALAVACASACSSSSTPATTTGSGGASSGSGAGGIAAGGAGGDDSLGGQASWEVPTGSGGCNAVLYEPPVLGSPHVDLCSDLEPLSNPPTSGPHYPKWAHFKNYDEPVPRGFLIHALEHGALVLLHNCSDCQDEITAIEDYVAGKPTDNACTPIVDRRVIISPAPWLDVPFAVAAWGFMLKADCFDAEQVDAIYDDHYAKGPEDVCASGIDPFDPLQEVPSDCPL
jgi:Protein of unknown function (DUF3105)